MKNPPATTLLLAALSAAGLALYVSAAAQSGNPKVEAAELDSGELTQDVADVAFPTKPPYSPYAGRRYPTRPLFGDTHLHTSQSFDAIAFGTRLGPEQAYRFAMGEEVTSSTGQPARLSRPLDFLVVADHAEQMGVMGEVLAGNPALMGDATVRRWHEMLKAGGQNAMKVYYEMVASVGGAGAPLPSVLTSPEITRSIWERNIAAAEKFNAPHRFTTLIGYEWSSNTGGNNLHRVVVYRDGGEVARQSLPFSSLASDKPEDLWKAMYAFQEKTGGRLLAIPHNGNLSNGRMFPLLNPVDGKPFTAEYVKARADLEPLLEATQIKGDGETHPYLSPNDEFANYERWDKGNLDLSEAKKPDMLQFEYARAALKNGLQLQATYGVNPYRYGMIGSTDAHTALSAVAENNFFGKLPHVEPSAKRALVPAAKFGDKAYWGWEMTSSGYAAVWATENTREAVWDALKRRETYATTGTRMIVRFFGGWEFDEKDAVSRQPAIAGYAKGVPMGGDLGQAVAGKAPSFLVAALKDQIGANLDRIQIIKGWRDAGGGLQEKVYDVVWSGDRRPGPDGKVPAVGSTVDVPNATWTNTIGATELIKVWKDPDFNPALPAFYYARVLEIPTPRWTAYDAKYYGITVPKESPMVGQERAYTSPIWYAPGK